MTQMKIQTARKDHRCTLCGRRIPKGARYWYSNETTDDTEVFDNDRREHTNCTDFASEPHLPPLFNSNRSAAW